MATEPIKSRLVRIGNSQGVRLPKSLLSLCGIDGEIEIGVVKGVIRIRPARKPREGWEEEFLKMNHRGDDALIDVPSGNAFDRDDWEWK